MHVGRDTARGATDGSELEQAEYAWRALARERTSCDGPQGTVLLHVTSGPAQATATATPESSTVASPLGPRPAKSLRWQVRQDFVRRA